MIDPMTAGIIWALLSMVGTVIFASCLLTMQGKDVPVPFLWTGSVSRIGTAIIGFIIAIIGVIGGHLNVNSAETKSLWIGSLISLGFYLIAVCRYYPR